VHFVRLAPSGLRAAVRARLGRAERQSILEPRHRRGWSDTHAHGGAGNVHTGTDELDASDRDAEYDANPGAHGVTEPDAQADSSAHAAADAATDAATDAAADAADDRSGRAEGRPALSG
jgi:hypothetical protein